MDRVIVFGCGQLAEVANFYLSYDSDCIIEAFVVDKEYNNADEFAENRCLTLILFALNSRHLNTNYLCRLAIRK